MSVEKDTDIHAEIDEHLTKNERFYFYINCAIFIFNILFGLRFKSKTIVIAASIALILSIYVYNADYKENTVWLLDQITILAILTPGLYTWLNINKKKYPLAGILFFSATALYIYSIFSRSLIHSQSGETRIRWHVILHVFTTLGHIMLHSEPKIYALNVLLI